MRRLVFSTGLLYQHPAVPMQLTAVEKGPTVKHLLHSHTGLSGGPHHTLPPTQLLHPHTGQSGGPHHTLPPRLGTCLRASCHHCQKKHPPVSCLPLRQAPGVGWRLERLPQCWLWLAGQGWMLDGWSGGQERS